MNWSQEKVLLLIELYRERPILWDTKRKDYKDRNKKSDALTEISVVLNEEKEEVSRKMKNLISHFGREIKKEKESLRSGSESDSVYKSNWFAYQSMLYLHDRNTPRQTTNTEIQVSLFDLGIMNR